MQGKQPGTGDLGDLRKRRQAAGGRMQVFGRVRRLLAGKGWSVEEVFFCYTRLVTAGEHDALVYFIIFGKLARANLFVICSFHGMSLAF